MQDVRYQEIMEQLGQPNSRSLLMALQQVENEVTQEIKAKNKKLILAALDAPTKGDAENILYGAL